MRILPGGPQANLVHAAELVADAARQGANLVLLPECLDLGWCGPSGGLKAEPVPDGETCRTLSETARRNSVYLCAGITERADDRIYNSAVLIDPQGELLLHHRKIHELDLAKPFYSKGDRLGVVETEMGILGLMICADGFADHLAVSRSLGLMGAQLILSPCAWAVPVGHDNEAEPYGDLWRDSYRPVAEEFGCAVLGTSNVGTVGGGEWKGRPCIGCSLVIGNDGEEVLQGPYGADAECILFVDWDGSSVRQAVPDG